MDRDTKNQHSKTLGAEIDQKIAFFRANLETRGAWPEKANELLTQVVGKTQLREISEVDQEMLSLVINDAIHGVDIQKQYPSFYKKLTEDAVLRDAFLDILDMAQEEGSETTETPTPLSEKLPFLSLHPQRPTIQQLADRWRVTWNQSIAQLNTIFLSHGSEPAYRGEAYLEDPWYVLVRDQIEMTGTQLNVFLEAAQQGEKPDELQLAVIVAIHAPLSETWPSLLASLTWGAYAETVSIGSQGRVAFPPVPLDKILNAQMTSFLSDLSLTLEPAA